MPKKKQIKRKVTKMGKRDSVLKEYRDTVAFDSLKARNLIKKLEYNEDHYLLQCIAQTYLDESRFNKDGTQRDRLEMTKLRMAERYIIKAFSINNNCADVLWVMGSVRRAYGQTDIAIYCFEKIIKLGISGLSYKGCKINKNYAKEMINDSRFQLYRIYHDLNQMRSAKKYLLAYKRGIEKGIHTIYKPLNKFLLD